MPDALPRTQRLESVADAVRGCTRCPLSASRTRAVPGAGPADAPIMFIGEGPGFHEDRQGVPFVGAAGQLLNQLLAGIGLRREQVYITNIVKCRPPGNRDPERSEIEACRAFLDEQIELIDPRVVVTLGSFAMEYFLPGERIGQVHGVRRRVGGRVFVPILHPAAALHKPEWRPKLHADFQALGRALEDAGAGVPRSSGAPAPGFAGAADESSPDVTEAAPSNARVPSGPATQPSLF